MALPHNTMYWHCHHDLLCEFVTNPNERIEYIAGNKSWDEIEIRLRLFKPIKGTLPPEVLNAWAAYYKIGTAYDKTWNSFFRLWSGPLYHKVWDAYDEAIATSSKELKRLHAEECPDCPWDGKTIFSCL